MKTETLKNAVIAVLLIIIGILIWLCFDSITEPRLTESMIEQTEEKVQVKTDAVRQILRKADTNAAEVAPRVKRHVDSLGSADVARELNALLQLSRVERRDSVGSAGMANSVSGLLDDGSGGP